ncbi:MAG: hypothetical protein AAFV45_13900 [Pseudomonadota bacterium]
MSLHAYLPIMMLALLMSVVAMIWSVGADARDLTLMIGLMFPACVILVAIAINRRPFEHTAWTHSGSEAQALPVAVSLSQTNARLMALVYAWGGAAMLGCYTLTRLWWWHSWQYGLGMLAIAAGLSVYAWTLGRGGSRLGSPSYLNATAWMSVGQAVAAVAGLAFLMSSGKVEAGRADWAANTIFLTGGLGIACLSVLAAFTHWRISRARPAPLIGA